MNLNKKIFLVLTIVILIIAIIILIVSKYYRPKLNVWTTEMVMKYFEDANLNNVAVEPREIIADGHIRWLEGDLKNVIINTIEQNNKYFNAKDYEFLYEKMDENTENYSIKLVYKIGEFYTNSFFEILIENDEIIQILDYTNEKPIDKKKINLLKRYSIETDEVKKSMEAISEVFKNYNYEIIDTKLFFNIDTNTQYILIKYLNNDVYEYKAFILETEIEEYKQNPITSFLLNF